MSSMPPPRPRPGDTRRSSNDVGRIGGQSRQRGRDGQRCAVLYSYRRDGGQRGQCLCGGLRQFHYPLGDGGWSRDDAAVNNLDLFIGAGHDGTGALSTHSFFQGKLDEVGLYNRSLTGPEIASLYAIGSGGKCASPVFAGSANKTVECGTPWTFDVPQVINPCASLDPSPTILSTVTNDVLPRVVTRTWLYPNTCGLGSATFSQAVTVAGPCVPSGLRVQGSRFDRSTVQQFAVPRLFASIRG